MKLTLRLKGGPGSGNFNHVGIPGHVGGSSPNGTSPIYGISKDSELDKAISSGNLDIPPAVKRRKYNMNADDPGMVEYAAKVWDYQVKEMLSQGIPKEKITTVEQSLSQLLASNDKPEAKVVAGALLSANGASKEEVSTLIRKELTSRADIKRYTACMELAEYVVKGGDPLSDEAINKWYNDAENMLSKRTAEDIRNPDYWFRKSYMENVDRYVAHWKSVESYVDSASDPDVAKAFGIIQETSQRLYDRNIEGDTLYRGIYDLPSGTKGREREGDYLPVKAIAHALEDRYERVPGSYDEKLIPAADSVEFASDVIIAWTPAKQIAKTFAAGGGLRTTAISRKAILAKKNVASTHVALYWPAIYSQLGSYIDTKEVWLYNPSSTMTVQKSEFERLK